MAVSSADIATAVLNSTRDGTYPESEEVLTSNLSAFSLKPALQLIREAKQQIEVSGLLSLPVNVSLIWPLRRPIYKPSAKIARLT